MKPSIVVITHCFPANSKDLPGNFLYDFFLELKKFCEIIVITPDYGIEKDFEFLKKATDKVVFYDWGDKRRLAEFKTCFKDIKSIISMIKNGKNELKKVLKTEKVSLVLSSWAIPAGIISYRIKKRKILWALGSDINNFSKSFINLFLLKNILSNQDNLLTNSYQLKKKISKLFGFNSQILTTTRILEPKTKLNRTEDYLSLLFVGRIENVKGLDILINALHYAHIENFTLKVIGDGSLRSYCYNLVNEYNLQSKIHFLGNMNGDDVAAHMVISDYLIIPSRSESMPVVFWEAMQMSLPVIASNCGDLAFYAEKFDTCRIFDGSVRDLSEILNFIYHFPLLREQLSKNTSKAVSFVNPAHNAEKFYKNYLMPITE
ncbi:MAG: glycosyltransferase [Candidatus Delongbacteria bacterium]|nr:glycosyltransferase [Candidatus Delongbacteria bacterium]MBN2833400.1 glycosyltransferase [Candidatus Delongbacteria bacterium]